MAFLDETGLAELWALIKAEDEAVTKSLEAADVKLLFGSYTGTGNAIATTYKSLTLDIEPKLLIVHATDISYRYMCIFVKDVPRTNMLGGSSQEMRVTWSGTTVQWKYNSTQSTARDNLDNSGTVYNYIAIS